MTLRDLALAGDLAQCCEPAEKVPVTAAPTVMEPKCDGWRILAEVYEGGVHFYSRAGNLYDGQLPKVEEELLANFPPGTWLDGEAVSISFKDGKVINEWSDAQSVMTTYGGHAASHKITFMVFDMLAHRGIDARSLPFSARRELLESAFDGAGMKAVSLIIQTNATQANYEKLVTMGFEGAVVKTRTSPYASGCRGHGWTKLKKSVRIEGVIMGFKDGKGGFTGLIGSIIFGQHDATGKLIQRGSCSGLSKDLRVKISQNKDAWLGRVIEIEHKGRQKNGLRSPQFKRFRDDRLPESVLLHDE